MSDEKKKTESKDMIRVTKTVPVDHGGTGEEVVENDYLEIRPFVSEVARVRVSKGLTLNLGNYESARVEVDVSLPCYPEELPETMEHVDRIVEAKLTAEVNSIRGVGKGK